MSVQSKLGIRFQFSLLTLFFATSFVGSSIALINTISELEPPELPVEFVPNPGIPDEPTAGSGGQAKVILFGALANASAIGAVLSSIRPQKKKAKIEQLRSGEERDGTEPTDVC